jgi:predicted enzyme related to lactoylglutathione lyase
MIKGIHGLLYSSQPDELRAFLRDKLQLPFSDVGGGWLIFDFKEGDLGVHPTEGTDGAPSGQHDISFFTDDIAKTVADLKRRGVKLDEDVADHGYGLVTHLTMPGGVRVQLYQPKYLKGSSATPRRAERRRARATKTTTKTKAKAKKRRR